MSDDLEKNEQAEGTTEPAALDLSSLQFGPAWARGESAPKERRSGGSRSSEGSGGKRPPRQGGERKPRREGAPSGGGGDRRQNNRNQGGGSGGGRPNQRNSGGRGGNDRRQQGRNDEPRQPLPVPEGIQASVMPQEDGLDQLAKEIRGGGRTYSVFDLAKLVLKSRERYNIRFTTEKNSGKELFSGTQDGSLWLTQEEALAHALNSDWLEKFYERIEVEGEAPKGNFKSIGRCGMSNEVIAPPNHHDYQPAIARLHRERFAHLNLEDYKKRIKIDHSEEAVEEWLNAMKITVQYRSLTAEQIAAKVAEQKAAQEVKEKSKTADQAKGEKESAGKVLEAPKDETPAEEAPTKEEAPIAEEAEAKETPVEAAETHEETPEEATNDPSPEGEATPAATEASADEVATEALLEDAKALRQHFQENHFATVFKKTGLAFVSGNIPRQHLSLGLFNLLLETAGAERTHPGKLAPILCRQFSGRHLAVFKWKKMLKVGPSRPHPLPEDNAIAERPQQIIDWVSKNFGRKIEQLWKAILPEDCDDETKHAYYHDLHWLLNQGFILLFSNNSLYLGKPDVKAGKERAVSQKETTQADAKEAPEKKAEDKPAKSETPAQEKSEPSAEVPSKEPVVEAKKEEPPKEETPKAEESKSEKE